MAPAELENHIRGLEGVTDVAVIGVANARAGEVPRAYVVKGREGLTEEDVKVNTRDANPLLILYHRVMLLLPSPHTNIWLVESSLSSKSQSQRLARSSGRT